MAAAPLFASQSLQLAPATRSTGFIPANTPSWSNLGDLRIEGHVFNYVAQAGTTVGIFELDSDMCIKILGDNELVFGPPTLSLNPALFINGMTSFRFRARRDTSTASFTLEVWDESSGSYQIAKFTDPKPLVRYNRSNIRFSIGSFYEPTTVNAAIGMLRVYDSAGPTGGSPPQRRITSGYGNLIDFEFEGGLTDSGPYHLNSGLAFSGGSTSFVTTAVLPPVISLDGLPVTVRAGVESVLNAAASFSNSDNPVLTHDWRIVNLPITAPRTLSLISVELNLRPRATRSGNATFSNTVICGQIA